ncbi:MAG: type 4a pilus biogenesis protein PilO [Candidatus Omnitrophota bacterium]|nr:type 4a pilus biogenesis protein PilO [Candidatus Omnitrophota bacterium]
MIDFSVNVNKEFLNNFMKRKDVIFNIILAIVALLIVRVVNGSLNQRAVSTLSLIDKQKKINVSVTSLLQLQNKFNDYKNNLPGNINAFTVLDKINEVISGSGMRLNSIVPAEQRDKIAYVEYPITIRLEATYSDLAILLKKLEDLKVFKVLNLDIAPIATKEGIEGQSRLSVNISLLVISLEK